MLSFGVTACFYVKMRQNFPGALAVKYAPSTLDAYLSAKPKGSRAVNYK